MDQYSSFLLSILYLLLFQSYIVHVSRYVESSLLFFIILTSNFKSQGKFRTIDDIFGSEQDMQHQKLLDLANFEAQLAHICDTRGKWLDWIQFTETDVKSRRHPRVASISPWRRQSIGVAREKDGTPTACNPIPCDWRYKRRSETRYIFSWDLIPTFDIPDVYLIALFLDVYRQEAVYLLAKYISESQLKALLQHLGYKRKNNCHVLLFVI